MTDADSHFDSAPPDWAVSGPAEEGTDAKRAPAPATHPETDDPFAASAIAAAAEEAAAGADPFAGFDHFEVPAAASAASPLHTAASHAPESVPPAPATPLTAAAPAAAAGASEPQLHSAAPVDTAPMSLLPDSEEYIAALERRLARLHNRKAKPTFKHRIAGAEFLAGSGAAAFSNNSAAHGSSSASSAATASWLDMPDSVAASASAHGAEPYGVSASAAAVHSSDEEGDEVAAQKRRQAPPPLPYAKEESVALLSRHRQRIDLADADQLQQAQASAASAVSPTQVMAASISLPADTESAAAVSSSDAVAAAAPSSGSSAAASSIRGSSSNALAAAEPDAPSPAAPSVYAIESSDGDETAAPRHEWRSAEGMALPNAATGAAEPEADPSSGVLTQRALYYQSAAAVAQITGSIEEAEQCVIS